VIKAATPIQLSSHECSQRRYQALYNYIPRNEDELELREGDVVDVMEKCDDGWFVGKVTKYEPDLSYLDFMLLYIEKYSIF